MRLSVAFLALFIVASNSVFSASVSDSYGNTADAASKITWVDFKGKLSYNKYDDAYDDRGLRPLFNLAQSLIYTAVPGDLPYDAIKEIVRGTFYRESQWYELMTKNLLGVSILFLIGGLFFVFFPLIGCCFCCCRCCNNCGGKKKQDFSKFFLRKRLVFGICLSLCVVFILAGTACVLVTSGQIPDVVKQTDKFGLKAMQDVDAFFANTVNEMSYLSKDGYSFAKEVMLRDLDNIDTLLGLPVRDQLATVGGVKDVVQNLISFESSNNLEHLENTLSNSYNALVTSSNNLYYQVNTVKANLETNLQNCPVGPPPNCGINSSTLSLTFNESNLPDILSGMTTLNKSAKQNFSTLALDVKKTLDDIPEAVYNDSLDTITSMKSRLNDVGKTIDSSLDSVRPIANLNATRYSHMVTKYADVYLSYDHYRDIVINTLVVLTLGTVLMMVLGLIFGTLCSSHKELPWKRGPLSTCGGNCLMTSVGFMFIFGPWLMLLTTIIFASGTVVEKFACVPLTDPSFKIYKELFDGPANSLIGPGYPLAGFVLQNSNINLTFSGVLQGCKNNEPAYKVLSVSSLFDVKKVLDYSQTIDINKTLGEVEVNLSSIKLLITDIENKLHSLNYSVTLNQTQITDSLSLNLTTTDLFSFAAWLNDTADMYQNISASTASALRNSSIEVAHLQIHAAEVIKDKQALLNATTAMIEFRNIYDTVKISVQKTQNYLNGSVAADIRTQLESYSSRVKGVADDFVSRVYRIYAGIFQLNTDLGKCRPLWTVYEELTSTLLCGYVSVVMNCFWISFGCCLFFFTPSIIFSVKLAKHYRCMKHEGDGFDEIDPDIDVPCRDLSASQSEVVRDTQKTVGIRRNKVAPESYARETSFVESSTSDRSRTADPEPIKDTDTQAHGGWMEKITESATTSRLVCCSCSASLLNFKFVVCTAHHKICSNCMTNTVKKALKSKKVNRRGHDAMVHYSVECPLKGCHKWIPLAELKKILEPVTYDAIHERMLEDSVKEFEKREGVLVCPCCGVMVPVHGGEKVMNCFKCGKSTCRYCKEEYIADDGGSHSQCGGIPDMPSHWETKDPTKKGFIRITLDGDSPEYKKVATMFYRTMSATIVSIERVENPELWRLYADHRNAVLQKNGKQSLNEIKLFHGTNPDLTDIICEQNLDFRLSGSANGTVYGQGTYFASYACYSHSYSSKNSKLQASEVRCTPTPPEANVIAADSGAKQLLGRTGVSVTQYYFGWPFPQVDVEPGLGSSQVPPSVLPDGWPSFHYTDTKKVDTSCIPPPRPGIESNEQFDMFVCSVVVGKFTKGERGMKRPPPVGSEKGSLLYDSVVNQMVDPYIFVIFENRQYYPEYVIRYTSTPYDYYSNGKLPFIEKEE